MEKKKRETQEQYHIHNHYFNIYNEATVFLYLTMLQKSTDFFTESDTH